jgi:excisionase family DNA binding protein
VYGPNHRKPEAARLLAMSITTLERRIREGEITTVKAGRYSNSPVLIPQSAIDAYLVAYTVPATAGPAAQDGAA